MAYTGSPNYPSNPPAGAGGGSFSSIFYDDDEEAYRASIGLPSSTSSSSYASALGVTGSERTAGAPAPPRAPSAAAASRTGVENRPAAPTAFEAARAAREARMAGAPQPASRGATERNIFRSFSTVRAPPFQDPALADKLNPAVAERFSGGARRPVTLRNNNMGAVSVLGRRSGVPSLPGYTGKTPRPRSEGGSYARFATPEHGVAAASQLLERYGANGLNTLNSILSRWAVDDAGYADGVSRFVGTGPDDPLDLSDPEVRSRVLMGISAHESGLGVPVYRPEVFTAGTSYSFPQGYDAFDGRAPQRGIQRDPMGNPVPPEDIGVDASRRMVAAADMPPPRGRPSLATDMAYAPPVPREANIFDDLINRAQDAGGRRLEPVRVPYVEQPEEETAQPIDMARFDDVFSPPNPRPRPERAVPAVTVQRGETLWEIADRELGDANRWREIASLNGIRDPRRLPPGVSLSLPGGEVDMPTPRIRPERGQGVPSPRINPRRETPLLSYQGPAGRNAEVAPGRFADAFGDVVDSGRAMAATREGVPNPERGSERALASEEARMGVDTAATRAQGFAPDRVSGSGGTDRLRGGGGLDRLIADIDAMPARRDGARFEGAFEENEARPELQRSLEGNRGLVESGDREREAERMARNLGLSVSATEGATMGFGGELTGVARGAKEALTGGSFSEGYERGRDVTDRAREIYENENPVGAGAAEIGGALGSIVATPSINIMRAAPGAAAGANILTRAGRAADRAARASINAGVTGGAYGALYGAGKADPGERGEGAREGVKTGAALGAGGAAALRGAGHIVGAAAKAPVVQRGVEIARDFFRPAPGAAQRVAGAIERDTGRPAAGAAAEMRRLQAQGHPVVIGDMGGERTRALARSSANLSPEARSAIGDATGPRFETQNVRAEAVLRSLARRTPENARMTREELAQSSQAARSRFYRGAYAQGDRPLRSPEIDRLASSPAVVTAMRRAVQTGQDRAVMEGFGAFNPGVRVTDDGRVIFRQGKGGVPTYPNLQYWDYVKRELDDMARGAPRGSEEATRYRALSRQLRGELDSLVPTYRDARGVAESVFNAGDAAEAGEMAALATGRNALSNTEVARGLARMTPEEQTLFREHYVAALVDRVSRTNDRRSILNAIESSPNARRRTQVVLGPQGQQRLETFLRAESAMDRLRTAMGNSTTTRQLVEAGLAGTAGGAYAGGFNPYDPGTWMGSILGAAAAAGVRRGAGRVDRNVAERVGRMLASNDPAELERGLALVSRSPPLQGLLRRVEDAAYRGSLPSLLGGDQ